VPANTFHPIAKTHSRRAGISYRHTRAFSTAVAPQLFSPDKSIHIFYSIWMVWNFAQFNDAKISLHAAKAKIPTAMAMMDDPSNGHYLPIDADIRLLPFSLYPYAINMTLI